MSPVDLVHAGLFNPICQPKTKAPTATAVAMMMDSIMSQAVLDLKL